jgi:transcriptional regulatory protein RtcR
MNRSRPAPLIRDETGARQRFLDFALSPSAKWTGNFRDLNGAVVRMATLAEGARISIEIAQEEIDRLSASLAMLEAEQSDETLGQILSQKALGEIDLFDRFHLAQVIRICRESRSMSEAGRQLFGASRVRKTSTNDADRLRKYLSRFGVDWGQIVDLSSSVR